MANATTARPGWWIGKQGRPVKYQLRDLVYDGGLEGEVWLAESIERGASKLWAVKILTAERIAPDRNARKALREWEQRWEETRGLTHSLKPTPGIVLPADIFPGPPPRPSPRSTTPPGSLLYMVSRWVESGLTLWKWRHAESDEVAWCDVLQKICALVDRLGTAGMVHRDLSPSNVMLENGEVCLIDFTFAAPAGAAASRHRGTKGYAAPEMQAGDRPVDPAIDRYAVGALAYFLLMGDHRHDDLWVVRQNLRRAYSESLANHVIALLEPDPDNRPASLKAWFAGVRRLVGHGIRPDSGHEDVALAVDGRQTTEIVAAGAATPLTVAAASSRRHPLLRTHSGHAPDAVRAVALARRGNGDLVMFTRDALGELTVRVDGEWRRPDRDLRLTGPLQAAGHGDGRASGFGVADDQLVQVAVGLDGGVEPARLVGNTRRVLAAASGLEGEVFIAVEDALGLVHCGPPDDLRRTMLSDLAAAALCVNADDEPVCVAARPGSAELNVITYAGDDWLADPTVPGKPNIRDVAALWLRTGLVIAIATDSGLWVKPEPDDWIPLWPHPVTRVALAVGYSWRVQVAALADGRVIYAEERGVNLWADAKPLQPASA